MKKECNLSGVDDMYILGIDIGTSGCKAEIFDVNGSVVADAHREYSLIYPSKGLMELDPNLVLKLVYESIGDCVKQCDPSQIKAISVSSQGEAIIPVDCNGKVLFNAVVTFDSRNEEEYIWFNNQFDKMRLMQITGLPIHPMFSATKILWLRNKHPDIYEKTWKLMCFGDFITFKLGGESAMDYSMASRTMLFDIAKKKWSREILEKCGIEESKLPKVVPAGRIVGTVNKEMIDSYGFSPKTVLVTGGHDQLCCSLGAGVLKSGVVMDSLGTTESMVCVDRHKILTDEMVRNNIPCSVYLVNGLYAYMTFLSCSGSLLKWFKEKLLFSHDENFYYYMDDYIKKNYIMPTNIYILPYFSGSGTPYLDFKAKGIISGLTLDIDRYQIYKAIIESTCLEQMLNLFNMEKCGIVVNELRCIGGGAKSSLWLQIKADITGKKVLSMRVSEGGCLGAAILAGIGSGLFENVEQASEIFVKVKEEYFPDQKMHERYKAKFQKYLKMYLLNKNMSI